MDASRFSALRRFFVISKNTIVKSDSIGMDSNATPDTSKYYLEGDLGYRILVLNKLVNRSQLFT